MPDTYKTLDCTVDELAAELNELADSYQPMLFHFYPAERPVGVIVLLTRKVAVAGPQQFVVMPGQTRRQ